MKPLELVKSKKSVIANDIKKMQWKIMTFITIFTIDFNDDIMSELKLSYIIEVEKASGSKFAQSMT